MCNLSYGIEKKALAMGTKEGEAKERISGIRKLIAALRSFDLPEDAIRQQVIAQYGDVDLSKYF